MSSITNLYLFSKGVKIEVNPHGVSLMSEDLKHLDDENFQTTVKEGVTLVDFYADWCGPCRMIGPIVEKLATKFKGTATIAKVNVDNAQDTTGQYGVTSIPTIIIFKNGQEVKRFVGVKDENTLENAIKASL